ncbi:desmoglein-2.1 [Rhinichthys klamathensis goyatoka]|uniref:desmoglein-2.1 n=1 Tax=Rhinichthys klamathensis goyatoka TaxID=3034132 RepID=UPI0024B52D3D|nr:desmoglein-2.1 [Rhinichthys klamathensis goyatoka]
MDLDMPLRYTLRGPGADLPPVGHFMVDEYKGLVRIIRPLDREERENYSLIGTAWFFNNTIAEDNIKVNIAVEDQNDNPPVFNKPERSRVYEGCPVGTFVTQVVAKDADKANTLHSKIAYTLIKQEPNDGQLFFAVNKDSGTISVNNPTLDREGHSSYVLTVQAADMYGSAQGNSATASITIDILDVNDNIPTLEKDEFSASIDENVAPIEVLRIQALDLDEDRTDNWLAVFEIVSGNEDGRFTIETDPKTNMGILYLNKPADFESASDMNLNLVVTNKAYPGAPLGSGAGAVGAGIGTDGASGASGASGQSGASGASGQSGASGASGQSVFFGDKPGSSVSKQKPYLVKISVKNKPEPPKFLPKLKPISVSENTKGSIPKVIDIYTAVEEDTGKTAEKVKYAKGYDPDNWISINVDTAEIKLNKLPDRESPYVVNGTYYAKILCITNELHPQTSTGTIALQVEDLNDNCPKLLDNVQTVCSDTRVVNVTAEDNDSYPNGAPLKFNLIQEKTRGKWNLQRINDASASLLSKDDLWPGFYQVTMEISDMQGLACPDEQVLHLEVCTCSEGMVCGAKMAAVRTISATLGAPGISFLFLGFLCLILVLMVLIKCECGSAGKGFTDIPFETKQHLVPYSTEGIGEDKEVLLMSTPPKLNNGWGDKITISQKPSGMVGAMNYQTPMDEIHVQQSKQLYNGSKMVGMMQESAFGDFYCDTDGAWKTENSASCQEEHNVFFDGFLKEYYTQKSTYLEKYGSPEEGLKKYDYEGEGSVAGSVDSCSYNESNDDLEFLNNLGLKFNTLAEVCGFRQTQSMSQADPQVIVNTVETTPITTAVSSDHMTNTVQPSPVEITVKSPLVQTAPGHGMVVQEPMYFGFDQPMQSNVLLSEDGLGQGFYIINGTPEADIFLTQGNGHALAHLGSGQHGIIGDSVLYSQIGHVGSVVSGESGQGRVTFIDGSVNGSILVGGLGPNRPMSPQPLYQVSGPVHINQRVIDGSFSSAQNDGQGTVTILESLVNGGEGVASRLLVSGPPIAEGHVNGVEVLEEAASTLA